MAWNPVFTVPVSTAVENFYFGGGYQSFPFTQVGQSYPPCVNLQAWPTPYFPVYPYMPYPSLHTVAVHPGWSRPYAGGYCFYPPWPSVLFQASSSQSGTVTVETRYASVAVGSRDDSVTECSTVSGSSAAVSEGSENRVTQDWNRVEPVIISPAEVGVSDVGGNPTEVNTVSASTLASRLVGGNAVASVELRNTAELTLTSLASFEPQNADTFDARKVAITPSESTTGKSLSAVQISLVKLSTDCSSDVPPRDQRKMVQNKLCASMSDKSRKRKVSLCRSGLSVSVHETLQKSSTGDPFLRLGDSLIDKAETDVKKEAGDHSKCLTKSRRRRRRNAVKRANLAGKVTNLPPFEQLKKPEPTCTTSSHSEHEKFRCVERRRKAKVGGGKSRVGISSESVVLTMQVGDDSHFALGQKKIKATVTSSDVSPAESSFGSKAQVGCDSGRKIAGSEAKRLNDRDHAACFTSLTASLLMPASQGPHQFSDLSPAESLKTRLSHDCLDSDEVGNFARTQQMNVANEIRASETSSVCHNDNEEAYMVIDSDGSSDSGTEIPRQEFLPEMLMSFSEGELTSQSSAVACGSTDGLDTVGKCSKIRRSLSKGEITDDDDDGDNDVDDDVFTVEVFSDDGNITEGKEEAVHLLCQESLSEEPNQRTTTCLLMYMFIYFSYLLSSFITHLFHATRPID